MKPSSKTSSMKQHQASFLVMTRGRGFVDVTAEVGAIVAAAGVGTGVCTLFLRHTSAGLLIQENADSSVRRDLEKWLARLAPDGDEAYEHDAEGPDDMAAHLRSVLTRTSESIPVLDARLALGQWQAIYLAEHRTRPHSREVLVHVVGE
jgi:secondary thiamine-phosphate synthase enzyme